MIDISSKDISKEYEILLNELNKYDSSLLKKPKLLFITKFDLKDMKNTKLKLPENVKSLFVSSTNNFNIKEAITLMHNKIFM